ncbi:NF-kappa-B inhibitor alpha-like [Heterodontus francisci]|uniref:NF-kappa-B inhibitor alpha-like n=1 Tax=Heterodontus francisci TaxID=7792 RepID=UPI00355BDC16
MNEKGLADLSVNFREAPESLRNRRKHVKLLDTKFGVEGERLDSGIDSMQEADETVDSVSDQMENLNLSCGSVEKSLTQSWTSFRSEDGDTFLHLAILHQRPDIASFLLWSEPSVIDICNNSRQSPLHLSVIMSMPEVTRELVQAGADLESLDIFGNTALHLACEQGDMDCVSSLLNLMGTADITQRHVQDLERRNYCGHTCLHIAAMKGDCETVERLLASGANINAQEPNSGRTPLHLAVEFQHREVVQLLIERGVDVNRMMYNGCTAFHLMAGRPDQAIQEQLFQLTSSSLIPLYETSDSDSETEWDTRSDCEMPLDYDDLQIGGHSLH